LPDQEVDLVINKRGIRKHPSVPTSEQSLRSHQGLKQRARGLQWLLKLAFDLNCTLDRDESINLIQAFFKKNLKVDGFSLWLVSNAASKPELAAFFGVTAKHYLANRLMPNQEQQAKQVPSRRGYRYIRDLGATSYGPTPGSLLILAVSPESGTLLGFISLYRKKISSFDGSEISLLRETSRFIALHLAKISLFQSTQELAYVDPLTQVFNRRYFDQRFQKEIGRAQRYKRAMSVLMIDIDHFKKYNDRRGHLAGDNAIRQVTALLENNLRKADVVCRYGGEEFVVILPEIDLGQASKVAEKLRKAVMASVFPGEGKAGNGRLTISIGVAAFPENGKHAEQILLRADQALYKAKNAGRNQVMIADPQ